MSQVQVYVVSGCRTPVGNFQGQFERIPAIELGTLVIEEALKRANLKPEDVSEVIFGHVLTAGQGQNTARQAAIGANIPVKVPAYTINMLCGSGLKTVCLGFQAIRNNDSSIVVAGGQENMTQAQHTTYLRGCKLGELNLADSLLRDGLTDAFNKVHMGNTIEHVAKKYNVSRADQDEYAVKSQNKAEHAIKSGYFDAEIVAVTDKKSGKVYNKDEFPKFGTTIETLSKLRPCFEKSGTVTAGNASGINDGAAAVILCSEEQVLTKNLKPLAKIIATSQVGLEPMCMGLGPIEAVNKVLQKAKWTKEEVDLFELNEAFAGQSIIVKDMLKVDESKLNINGGAIALGHPIGCSGTRILVTLIYNLIRLGKKKGVASLCIGGGMGIAVAIEKCT